MLGYSSLFDIKNGCYILIYPFKSSLCNDRKESSVEDSLVYQEEEKEIKLIVSSINDLKDSSCLFEKLFAICL